MGGGHSLSCSHSTAVPPTPGCECVRPPSPELFPASPPEPGLPTTSQGRQSSTGSSFSCSGHPQRHSYHHRMQVREYCIHYRSCSTVASNIEAISLPAHWLNSSQPMLITLSTVWPSSCVDKPANERPFKYYRQY